MSPNDIRPDYGPKGCAGIAAAVTAAAGAVTAVAVLPRTPLGVAVLRLIAILAIAVAVVAVRRALARQTRRRPRHDARGHTRTRYPHIPRQRAQPAGITTFWPAAAPSGP